jgi:hypothetical protein
VHGHCPFLDLGQFKEVIDDFHWGAGAVGEVEFVMVDALVFEIVGIVGLVV